MSVYIIAEAGVNHNGNVELAKKMVDEAKSAGADCIKFQTFVSKNLASKSAGKAAYQKNTTDADESQLDMLKKLELSFAEFAALKEYCAVKEIYFLSTAFDFESVDFLESLGMETWKIPSGEITDLPYLIRIAKTGKAVILSTGMSTLREIEAALDVLNRNGAGAITLLHCTTEYPAAYAHVNLHAMATMRKAFGLPVGYSDHTQGIEVSIAAAALGAVMIEKHFTLDAAMEGPDHKSSLEPDELKAMVTAVRHVEMALGNGEKRISPQETQTLKVARKSITASRGILKGECFTAENLTVKRPGTGLSPMKWFDVIGQTADRDYEEDDLIE
ncbi:MAG: N-acetylneuraminate synthase [Clostridiales bacterium]|nr:N-acetylneuraminate synthase [Clostridiales bacterium]